MRHNIMRNKVCDGLGLARCVAKLVARSVAKEMKRHCVATKQQGDKILGKVKDLDESMAIVARHLARTSQKDNGLDEAHQ